MPDKAVSQCTEAALLLTEQVLLEREVGRSQVPGPIKDGSENKTCPGTEVPTPEIQSISDGKSFKGDCCLPYTDDHTWAV